VRLLRRIVLVLLLTPSLATAQSPAPRDQRAIAALQQSLATMGSVPADSIAVGTLTFVAGSTSQGGTIRVLNRGSNRPPGQRPFRLPQLARGLLSFWGGDEPAAQREQLQVHRLRARRRGRRIGLRQFRVPQPHCAPGALQPPRSHRRLHRSTRSRSTATPTSPTTRSTPWTHSASPASPSAHAALPSASGAPAGATAPGRWGATFSPARAYLLLLTHRGGQRPSMGNP